MVDARTRLILAPEPGRVAELLQLDFGGWVVDTPGIRQMELWDVIPEEVAGLFPEMRPFVSMCRFPDCTHTHEPRCAVRRAISEGVLDEDGHPLALRRPDPEMDAALRHDLGADRKPPHRMNPLLLFVA